jgi:nucleoside-diphosphate-sugar epimerase
MKKKIIIIGGTGFLGYHLCKFFLSKKYIVYSLSKNKPNKIRYLKKVKYLYADISKFNQLSILKNLFFNYVINCGGYVDHINKKKTFNSHYIGLKNLYKIFKEKKITHFLQIGSSSEYGLLNSPQKENYICKPKTIYGTSKLRSTKFLLAKKNFPFTILRFYQIYGPYQDNNRFIPFIINSCIKNKTFPCSAGTQLKDFIFIDDAVSAVHKCLNNKSARRKIINIGWGNGIQLKKIINLIIKTLKQGKPIYGVFSLRKDEPEVAFPDINKSKKYLGWSPKIDFKKGIVKTINFYKRKNLYYKFS